MSEGARHVASLTARTVSARVALLLACMLATGTASGAPSDAAVKKAMALAHKGECVEAVPMLEQAELDGHRPSTSLALAKCYIAIGESLKALELYKSVAAEDPAPWKKQWWEAKAIKDAATKCEELERTIPTVAIQPAKDYPGMQVFIGSKEVTGKDGPFPLPPHEKVTVVVRAKGYSEYRESFEPAEGERLVLRVALQSRTGARDSSQSDKKRKAPPSESSSWIGVGFQGYVIPKPMWHLIGDGGRTAYIPAGRVTYSSVSEAGQLTLGLGWVRLGLSPTPLKPNGNPDTDYEIIESDLHGPMASLEWHWLFSLSKAWSFRLGAGAGFGVFAFGNLYRTQAFPPGLVPSAPENYAKCNGPNNPAGSYSYCNQLRDDASHYNGYAEPGWAKGGKRPDIFPWVALPELGLSWSASKSFVFDLDLGLSIGGIMVALTGRSRI